MAYGLQTFDGSGNEVVSIVDRLSRLHGTYSVSLGQRQGTFVSVPGMVNDGTWGVVKTGFQYIEANIANGGISCYNYYYYGSGSCTLIVYRY